MEEKEIPTEKAIKKENWKSLFFTFKGRLNRKKFLYRSLALIGISIVAIFLTTLLVMGVSLAVDPFTAAVVLYTVSWGLNILFLIMGLSLLTRRWHDMGYGAARLLWFLVGGQIILTLLSIVIMGVVFLDLLLPPASEILMGTWLVLGSLYGLISLVIMIISFFKKGERRDNRFGPDPLAEKTR